jgi:hypothetical protein
MATIGPETEMAPEERLRRALDASPRDDWEYLRDAMLEALMGGTGLEPVTPCL